MSLTRCPQCGRVADGRSCFACGYEWPKSGAPAAAPSAPPQPTGRTGPFSSPLAPPRAPTPQVTAVPAPPQHTGLQSQGMPSPSPFSAPPRAPTPGPSPFSQPPSPFSQPPSPFSQPPSPFSQPPQPASPFSQPLPQPASPFAQPSFTQPAAPPMPDEIVIDTDLEFSLMKESVPPMGGLPPPPPGMPPPPMPSFPAPPPGMPPPPMAFGLAPAPVTATQPRLPPPPPDDDVSASTLDTIFEGIDITVPKAPARMNDPALDAGDFMIDTGPPPAPAPPPGSDDWASSSALGADLLAAFNSADPTESEIPIEMDSSPDLPPGHNPVAQFGAQAPVVERLHGLSTRLRNEGRGVDADLVTEAMALLKLQG